MKEQRQYVRVKKEHLASYEIVTDNDEVREVGMALEVDMSVEGLSLEIPAAPKVGDNMKIQLALEDTMVDLLCEVVWVNHGEHLNSVGFKLKSVPNGYTEILKEWFAAQ